MKKNVLLILLMIISCLLTLHLYNVNKQLIIKTKLIENGYYQNGTYTDVNLDKTISKLKKENKELYDSIKDYKDEINFLTQFKYQKEYQTDTIYIKTFNPQIVKEFKYENEKNDSINYKLTIGSEVEPSWYSLDVHVSDEFTIINRNDDNVNRTTITSDNGGEIEDVTVFNKKKTKFSDHFSHGIVGGIGYGVVNRNIDFFVGYGVTITF